VVTDLERHLETPLRARAPSRCTTRATFGHYVRRIATSDCTTVWANIDSGTVTAVLDDHTNYQPGWRSHTVRLDLQDDPDWVAWNKLDGKLVSQQYFAEFLEQQLHTIISPPAADIYEVATSLQAKRSVSFRSGVKTKSGDIQFTYDEETTAKGRTEGQVEIPDEFTLRLAPFAYATPVELTAKLRYRITEGELQIGYKLLRPLEVRRERVLDDRG